MSSHKIELTEDQSSILSVITKYKCISTTECAHWTHLPIREVEAAIPLLERYRLIRLSGGGTPKRYCPRLIAKKEQREESEIIDPELYHDEVVVNSGTEIEG